MLKTTIEKEQIVYQVFDGDKRIFNKAVPFTRKAANRPGAHAFRMAALEQEGFALGYAAEKQKQAKRRPARPRKSLPQRQQEMKVRWERRRAEIERAKLYGERI